MAKTKTDDLFERLHANGMRKKLARSVTDAVGSGRKRAPKQVRSALDDLSDLIGEVQDRASGKPAKRKAAAKKAAVTRRKKASARSAAAKKGARTRAKS